MVTFSGSCRLREPTVLAELHLPSDPAGRVGILQEAAASSAARGWAPTRGVTPQT